MADQRKESAVAFLEAAIAYYAKLGVRVERIMTDNGSCYRSKTFRTACKQRGLRQVFTRPLHTQDQWQGRTVHPNRATRMGLRAPVSQLRSAIGRTDPLVPSLQLGTGALAAAGHGRGGRSGPQVFLLVDLRQFGADRNEYVNGRNSPHLLDLA
jgi:Integrase core domain